MNKIQDRKEHGRIIDPSYALTGTSAQQAVSQLVKILRHAMVERFPAAA